MFIKAYIDDKDKKSTDTHYRCQDGCASFNYRMLFDIKAPEKPTYELVLQAWDFDLLKSNDYICEWVFDLTEMLNVVRLTQQPMQLNKKYFNAHLRKKMPNTQLEFDEDDAFWVTTIGSKGEEIKVKLDIRILPGAEAANQKVGDARNEPNVMPYLPPPVGRITFSLNPFAMLAQLVNKEYLSKLQQLICILVCVACCVAMAPMIISNLTSFVMLKMIGLQ